MTNLRTAGCVAAWAGELPREQRLARMLLDEPIVMLRDALGASKVLLERCPAYGRG